MQDYQHARDLIRQRSDGDFEGEKTEELIKKAEFALGLKFPPTYRRFLAEFGCGNIGGDEFFGLVDENFDSSSVPDAIWLTLEERRTACLANNYVIIYSGGDGTYYAIDTAETLGTGENPIVRISANRNPTGQIANSFGAFLKQRVSALS